MATNSPRGPSSTAKPWRPAIGKGRDKDENLARAAGAVVASGIAWSLFRSITGRVKQQVHIHERKSASYGRLANSSVNVVTRASSETLT